MREWSKSLYENSASSRCWWFTPYDDGWDVSVKHGPDLREDKELRAIVEMEAGLDPLPEWARKIAETSIRSVPPCGHYTFPKAYLETVNAIGRSQPQSFLHTCFTVDSKRKRQMADYCLCLDAWLAGASATAPASELMALGFRKIDWLSVCQALWTVLGDHTELKDLLVERTLIQTRWWIKSSVWEDDLAVRFGRDQYLGDFAESSCFATDNGNPNLRAPAFKLDASQQVQNIEARLKEICPDWPWFRNLIVDGSWPCAPKTFRYLERLLWSIGKERPAVSLPSFPLQNGDVVPDFLQAADTCPAPKQAAQWWQEFLKALSAWWQDKPASGSVAKDIATRLGDPDDLKRWLVRLYAHRLAMLARHGATIGQLVNPDSGRNWGTKDLET
ncbi:MAG: hypothetical protein L6437_10060 [Kiritimatiellae bacterium]|nr:hypothetical protein [Kiritimatiellia bacterium]